MAEYTEDTARRLTQMLRETEIAYKAYKQAAYPGGRVEEWPEWCANRLLASGKLADLFLAPSAESLREESSEAG